MRMKNRWLTLKLIAVWVVYRVAVNAMGWWSGYVVGYVSSSITGDVPWSITIGTWAGTAVMYAGDLLIFLWIVRRMTGCETTAKDAAGTTAC